MFGNSPDVLEEKYGPLIDLIEARNPTDCENCGYNAKRRNSNAGHCYMFEKHPGPKCSQFREVKEWN